MIFATRFYYHEGHEEARREKASLSTISRPTDRLRELRLGEVRKKIQTGLDQLDRGEGIPGDQARAKNGAEERGIPQGQAMSECGEMGCLSAKIGVGWRQ